MQTGSNERVCKWSIDGTGLSFSVAGYSCNCQDPVSKWDELLPSRHRCVSVTQPPSQA